MANETKHVAMNKLQQEKLDQILRGIAKERKVAIEADLDSRMSYREKDPKNPKAASWSAYSRFLLSDGHTVYCALRTMKFSVSSKPDKYAQGRAEKRAKKLAAREARKAARLLKEETKAAAKEAKDFDKIAAAVKKPKAAKTPKASKKAAKPAEELDGIPTRPVKA